MLAEAIRSLYGHNRWAMEQILVAAEGLTSEQWLAAGTAGHGSIRDTVVHAIGTQRGWCSWWDGSLPPMEAYNLTCNPNDYPDVAAVRALWKTVADTSQTFFAGLTDADVERIYSFPMANGMLFRLELWQMMLHVSNHGTQHRSEVAAMLTAAGHSPGQLDLLGYFQPVRPDPESGSGPEPT